MRNNKLELLERGYTCVTGVLPADLLDRLRTVTDRMVDDQSEETRKWVRSQGSMLSVHGDPIFAELITLPAAVDVLRQMGWPNPTFSDGYVISKPPQSPRLFWHYDWFIWEDAYAYTRTDPPQVAFMYYLTDTARANGCLRAIPGSHIAHNPLHDLLVEPHSGALANARDLNNPAFGDRPDETDLPARAGDVMIVDARLLHASHGNQSNDRRTVITLWYQPNFSNMPERIQAHFAKLATPPPAAWPDEARRMLEPMLTSTRYRGSAEPYGRQLYRRQHFGSGVG
jgi:hypothetical protein